MRGTVLYGPRDIRFEERAAPTIMKPTDAIIRITATCVCGSDLWPYRGINHVIETASPGQLLDWVCSGSALPRCGVLK